MFDDSNDVVQRSCIGHMSECMIRPHFGVNTTRSSRAQMVLLSSRANWVRGFGRVLTVIAS